MTDLFRQVFRFCFTIGKLLVNSYFVNFQSHTVIGGKS
jgi:hypothetical protein